MKHLKLWSIGTFVAVVGFGCKARTGGSELAGINSTANQTPECKSQFTGFAPNRGLLVIGESLPDSVKQRFAFPSVLANALGKGGVAASPGELSATLKTWLKLWESGAYKPEDFWHDAAGPLTGLDYAGPKDGPKALPKAVGLQQALGIKEQSWSGAATDLNLQLVAVVNRLDLWTGDADDGGESRLVFGHGKKTMLVIFEYKNPPIPAESDADSHAQCAASVAGAGSAAQVKYWGCRWQMVGSSAAFENDLAALLDDVTGPVAAQSSSMAFAGVAPAGTDKGGRIRTNDFLTQLGWELREFKVQDGQLKATTAKQALAVGKLLNPPKQFKDYVNANVLRVVDGQAIDGFFPFQRGHGESISNGTSTAWQDMYDGSYKSAFNKAMNDPATNKEVVACVSEGTSLPSLVQTQIRAKTTPSAKFHTAALNAIRLASCTGCHNHPALGTLAEGSEPTSGKFMHIDTHGNISAFLKAELPERQAFLEKAVCDPNPSFVTTKCFKESDKFPPRQITQ